MITPIRPRLTTGARRLLRIAGRERRIRGLRLGTKLMLLVLTLTLVLVPWLSFLALDEVGRALAQMQSHDQLLTAKNIATVFNGREDLLADLPVEPSDYERLIVRAIEGTVRLDGRAADWGEAPSEPSVFGVPGEDGSFALSLGNRRDMLFIYVEVVDDTHVYRDPLYLRLDNADQLRLSFVREDGEDGRIAVMLSESGQTTAFWMDADWQFAEALDPDAELAGPPETRVQGFVRETDTGYALELRAPFDIFGTSVDEQAGRIRVFGLAFVDVDDPESRTIRAVTHTLPTSQNRESFGLVTVRSPEAQKIIEGLAYADLYIRVIDAERVNRAATGSYRITEAATERSWEARAMGWLAAGGNALGGLLREQREPAVDDTEAPLKEVMDSALAGESRALRRRVGEIETIIAGHPIISGGAVIGLIAVEKNIDDILLFQRESIDKIALVAVSSFLVVLFCLIVFAGRLTWRIRRLRQETAAAIDDFGRLRANVVASGMTSADEIGDLARSVSGMLGRLAQHNTFLQRMPRTLRHEINNPLNTLHTSLEHLAQESTVVRDSKYLESAKRGVLRIGAIVENLADAANLEDSLVAEDPDVVDIQQIVESYVDNYSAMHGDHALVYQGTGEPAYARIEDYRIEQILDKLIDNAVDFHRANSPITVQLDVRRDTLRLTVANRGPMLAPEIAASVFESMVSRRGAENRLHFGLGLYVVRVIAEQHGGSVRAMNLVDGSGVAVIVSLPVVDAASEIEDTTPVAAAV
ncbi:MAG: ATP-binding protein [Gammaproteobacteria bacterium]|nr:ATP-binding protein [Gammaproteobacteria bacterium]